LTSLYFCRILLTIYLFASSQLCINAASLKHVKSFGTGNNGFFLTTIRGAAISKNKNIYVVDYKGCYIARFDWNGKFIKKLGQRGQGNGDLSGPKDIKIYGDKIFFNDMMNRRIVETDYELTKLTYHKIYTGSGFVGDWFMIGPNTCVGHTISNYVDFGKEYKVMKLLNLETQKAQFFFDKIPAKDLTPKQIMSNPTWILDFKPVFTVDTENKQLIISFTFPNNPVENYIYSYEGELLDQFSYVFDKHYQYPEHFKTGARGPKEYISNTISRLFFHKGHLISFIGKNKIKIKGRTVDSDRYFLIFDIKTKELKCRIPVPKNIYFYSIMEKGYMVGSKMDEDDTTVHIYKLEL
jgi:hypothetical protein